MALIFLTNLSYLLLKLTGEVFNLPISNLSTFDFKAAKLNFLTKSDVSTPVAFFRSDFVA